MLYIFAGKGLYRFYIVTAAAIGNYMKTANVSIESYEEAVEKVYVCVWNFSMKCNISLIFLPSLPPPYSMPGQKVPKERQVLAWGEYSIAVS